MKHNELSALIFVAVMAVGIFTGCQSSAPQAEEETTIAYEDMKTIEPPEDGWTLEQLNQVMYLNGKPLKLPCTLNDLGEEYEFKDVGISSDKTATGELLYKGKPIANFLIEYYPDDTDVRNIEINELCFSTRLYEYTDNDLTRTNINGIFLGASYDDMVKAFGNRDIEYEDENITSYRGKDVKINCSFEEEKIYAIIVWDKTKDKLNEGNE